MCGGRTRMWVLALFVCMVSTPIVGRSLVNVRVEEEKAVSEEGGDLNEGEGAAPWNASDAEESDGPDEETGPKELCEDLHDCPCICSMEDMFKDMHSLFESDPGPEALRQAVAELECSKYIPLSQRFVVAEDMRPPPNKGLVLEYKPDDDAGPKVVTEDALLEIIHRPYTDALVSVVKLPKLLIRVELRYATGGGCVRETIGAVESLFGPILESKICPPGTFGTGRCQLDPFHTKCTVLGGDRTVVGVVWQLEVGPSLYVPPFNTTHGLEGHPDTVLRLYVKAIIELKTSMDEALTIPVVLSNGRLMIPDDPCNTLKIVISCEGGYYLNDDKFCVPCEENTYRSGGGVSCRECPEGHYQDQPGSSLCKEKPGPTTTPRKLTTMTVYEITTFMIIIFTVGGTALKIYSCLVKYKNKECWELPMPGGTPVIKKNC